MRRRLRFEWKYWKGRPAWDSGITPPEVLSYLADRAPGRAIDLGCGTGTNAITLAAAGWQVTAVDFSSRALATARRKARAAGADIRFLHRSVTHLGDIGGPFDLALDIGCFHSLGAADRSSYGREVARLVQPGGTLLLYAFIDPEGGWPAEDDVRAACEPAFELDALQRGEFEGRPSGWFWWTRRP
ncbi:MAG TPA: class I SAM-dependent methyltransferase [Anaerolineales bacterium]|nr:class I SAM-dependent methyltransferase [Anaerolineales bacterium]